MARTVFPNFPVRPTSDDLITRDKIRNEMLFVISGIVQKYLKNIYLYIERTY